MITEEQRQLRRRYIGSSDAAAIMGLDPFRSAAEVWLEKTGRDPGFAGNEATDRGDLLEPAVLAWFAKEKGRELLRPDTITSGPLCWNPDAMLSDSEGVEAKTTTSDEDWGEPGTDQVPDRVVVQCHHAFAVVPVLKLMWVPVLMPVVVARGKARFDFRLYRVDRSDELAGHVGRTGADFMSRFILTDEQPDDFKPSLEVLKRIHREANKTVDLCDEIVDTFIGARAAKKQAEEDLEQAQAALLIALGDAEAGTYSGGQVTYFKTKRAGYEVKPTEFRTLRTKSGKGQ